jgi:hypothetical protein
MKVLPDMTTYMKVLPDMTTYMKVLPDMTTYRKSLDATSAVFVLTHLPEAGTSKTGQVKIIKEFVCFHLLQCIQH